MVTRWRSAWGCSPRCKRTATAISELRLVDSHGKRAGTIDGDAFRAATAGRFLSILRGDLSRRIYQSVADRAETIFADSIAAITPHGNGVEVAFENGPPRHFDLVVGADGLHSAVRHIAFPNSETHEKYLGCGVAAFNADNYPHRDEDIYVSYGFPRRQVARYSLRDGRTGLFFFFSRPEGIEAHHQDLAAQKAMLEEDFADGGWECPEILEALRRTDDLYFDVVSQIRLDRWFHDRVTLVGDACYCPSLLAGEGSALAMGGAYVLAGELKAADGDHEIAFRRYQERFKPFITKKQDSAETFSAWFAPKTWLGVHARNWSTYVINLPWISEWVMKRTFADDFQLPDYSG